MASTGDALDPTGTDTTKTTLSTDPGQPLTRRERREREAAAAAAATGSAVLPVTVSTAVARVAAQPAEARETTAVAAAHAIPAPAAPVASVVRREDGVVPAAFGPRIRAPRLHLPRKRTVAAGAVMALAAGLFATSALPAYAYGGGGSFDAEATSTSFGEEQTLQIPNATAILTVSRDGYTAPSPEELAAAQQAAEAAAQAALEAERAASVAASVTSTGSGSSANPASAFKATPPSGAYSGSAVIAYAMQFVGVVPYSAGNTPETGFGCDGLTQYVMGQFGISLPRGVSAQASLMQRIDASEAQPGDFLIYPGQHIGFYAGNGMMIDSPDWGRYVEYRPIWGSPYYARYTG